MNEIKVSIENWFPVQVLVSEILEILPIAKNVFENYDFNLCKQKDDYNGLTSYFTEKDLPQVENIEKFKSVLCSVATEFARQQGLDTTKYKLVIANIWVSRLKKGMLHSKHSHGLSHYSGTYYANTTTNSSCLRIHSPYKELLSLTKPPVDTYDSPAMCSWVDHQPSDGKLLIWNACISHEVLEQKVDENRDSISFNFLVENLVNG